MTDIICAFLVIRIANHWGSLIADESRWKKINADLILSVSISRPLRLFAINKSQIWKEDN
jgi:hypothetical protein